MPLLTPITFYRKHAFAYPHHILQEACLCLPPPHFTGSVPLLTPTPFYRKHAFAYPHHILQEACLCLPPSHFTGSMPLLTPITFYRKHAFAYPHHIFMTCGGHKVFYYATILTNVVEKLALEGRNNGNSFGIVTTDIIFPGKGYCI